MVVGGVPVVVGGVPVVVGGVVIARRIEVVRGSRRPKRLESDGGENLACRRVRGDNQGTRAARETRLQMRFGDG